MTAIALASPRVDVAATLARYASASCAQLDRLIARAALAEPIARDVDGAARALAPLIETLTGLAIGRAIGAVMQGVRRSFDGATAARAEAAMHSAASTLEPARAPALFALDDAPCRTFAGELRLRLRRRLALAPRDVLAGITAMADALTADELAPFARLIGLLADDPLLGDRFAPQLARAWRCFAAVAEGTAHAPTDALWARWLRDVRGEVAPAPAPTPAQLAAAGVVVQIG
jgi:hypothetical protein